MWLQESFITMVETLGEECELLDEWFRAQRKDTTDNTPEGVERPTAGEVVEVVSGISTKAAKRPTVQRLAPGVEDLQAYSGGNGKGRAESLEVEISMTVDILESNDAFHIHHLEEDVESGRDNSLVGLTTI